MLKFRKNSRQKSPIITNCQHILSDQLSGTHSIMDKTIHTQRLTEITAQLYPPFKNAPSKLDALTVIYSGITEELGHYINMYRLSELNDIIYGFLELTDQIIFEIDEGFKSAENSVEEYIIDDLYQRTETYLDLFNDIELYKKNLRKRLLNQDDPIIIRYYVLDEFIPLLISEFFEQPDLRKEILKSLQFFNDDTLINFFYDIAKNDYDVELRILALIGLKKFKYRFNNWHLLKTGDDDFNALIEHVRKSKTDTASHKTKNNSIFLYTLWTIELSTMKELTLHEYPLLFRSLFDISCAAPDNGFVQQEFNYALGRILKGINIHDLRILLRDKSHLKAFLQFLNITPVEFFDRVMMILDLLGDDFFESFDQLIVSGEFSIKEARSSLLSYLLSPGFKRVNV